ncbi:carbohydrate-binding WSC, partial [Dioszegia hungarica]
PPVGTDVNGFKYQGCFFDQQSPRTLAAKFVSSSNVTPLTCVKYCQSFNYDLAGVEYGVECYCDNVIGPAGKALDPAKCTVYACTNDITKNCGGDWAMALYA